MKKYLLIILPIISFFFTSCIEEVNIKDAFNIEPQIVLYGRICPQADTNYVHLYRSSVFFSSRAGNDIAKLTGAVVEISSDEKNWTRFSYNDSLSYFITKDEFLMEDGGTYYIRASHNDFETVTSSCTVPVMHDVDLKIAKSSFQQLSDDGSVFFLDKYYWKDYPNEENYYMLWRHAFYTWVYYEIDWYYVDNVPIADTISIDTMYYQQFNSIADAISRKSIITDQENDGGIIEVVDCCPNSKVPDWFELQVDLDVLKFMTMDKGCYLYEKSVNDYDQSMGVELMTLFEPVMIYSNIKNGLGFFGALSVREYSISELLDDL